MNKELQQKIKEAEAELKYLENISSQRWKGIRVEGFEDTAPEVVDQLVARQKRIIENLRDGKTEILKSNNMNEIQITKAKVLKEKVEIEGYYIRPDGKRATLSESCESLPHPDFVKAVQKLDVHAAVRCEFIPAEEIGDIKKPEHELLKDFNATGFSLTVNKSGNVSVIISAGKTLSAGEIMGFNTPNIRFADESDTKYPFTDILIEDIDECKNEAVLYIGGKQADDPQGKLDLKDPAENGGMKAVKGGKGKKKATADVEE